MRRFDRNEPAQPSTLEELHMAALCLLGEDGTIIKGWEIASQPLAVGRDESAEAIINDETLSRRHFVIWRQLDKYLIKDLSSRTGTSVDGKPIRATMLHHNDFISAGHSLFLFSEHPLSGAVAKFARSPAYDPMFLPAVRAAKPPEGDTSA
jgi:hypothetical protein